MSAKNLVEIKDLNESSSKVHLTGLIIAKGDYHTFKSRYNGKETATIWFTIRDSKRYFINCKLFGSSDYVKNCVCAYKIGDILTIAHPKVVKNTGDEYMPRTTSPFQLNISENRSKMYRESAECHPVLGDLKRQIFKPTSQCLKLCDLRAFKQTNKKCADLMIAVQSAISIKEVNTKIGPKKVCEVFVMDQTTDKIKLIIWNSAIIEQAEYWIPHQTILLLVDVECSYSNFERQIILQTMRRSIVIENPIDSPLARSLSEYLVSTPTAPQNELNVMDKIDVMNVEMIKEKSKHEREFSAVVYAIITRLDIKSDLEFKKGFSRYCKHCNQQINIKDKICSNLKCISLSSNGEDFEDKFDLQLDLSDHTGVLESCHMLDNYAESFFKYSLDAFKELSAEAVDEIYNHHILERHEVKIVVKRSEDEKMNIEIVEIKEIVN